MAGKTAIYYCDSTGCFVIMEMMKPIPFAAGHSGVYAYKIRKALWMQRLCNIQKCRNKCGGFVL